MRDDVQGEILGIRQLLPALARILRPPRGFAVFDLETTGVSVETDRIVEVTIARIDPGREEPWVFHSLVNPSCPIPKDASDIHGITDADVADAPKFAGVARDVDRLLRGADLAGFNHRRFDVRMVAAECQRVGLSDPCAGARLVDACRIFHTREKRDLASAMAFYCQAPHEDAHGTTADVEATVRVLLAQLDRYEDLPRDIDALDALNRDPNWIDADGKLVWRNGEAALAFGKHNGVPLRRAERSYLEWMVRQDWCPVDTRAIVQRALKGDYPVQPVPVEA